jgi:cytosine/adenosine deaminase-related metal-dependent hydrolase
LGSIEEGKLADLVIFDTSSPGMLCAAEQDPVAAIVLHSLIRDIETVMVNGKDPQARQETRRRER